MQITNEEFKDVMAWLPICIAAEDWPNPRATKDERTFYVATMPTNVPAYVLRKVDFMRLLNGLQTTNRTLAC